MRYSVDLWSNHTFILRFTQDNGSLGLLGVVLVTPVYEAFDCIYLTDTKLKSQLISVSFGFKVWEIYKLLFQAGQQNTA